MPSKEVLRIAAKKAFMSADIDNNGYLSIDEIELWCTTNYEWKNFLFRFESPKLIPYEKDTFEDFSKIDFRFFISEVLNTQSELEKIMKYTESYKQKIRKRSKFSYKHSKPVSPAYAN
eukprot:CAMPEP_0170548594 /NCGR_PEP_ID=MMETSP0211-20121228/6871_1 /TAXON_ID=311385 /ORGANISM="Pseudokeronopsis sp., Strain OXSARD2" /LENGTH=117 /DNA_ID=CAMNT_0010854205 /DNA_START=424 /DNA_END=777 /DNA_ORIENTATION=+